MNDCPIETTDEGGDPPCWAHLFEYGACATQGTAAGETEPRPGDRQAPPAAYAASEPDSRRATTRS